ncbi:MAG: helix-turn-helix transcriptional regulator [candidate division Zixibacteria bacterium]
MVKVALKKEAILILLAKRNRSQNWLAYRLGISSGYVSQLLNGKRMPSPDMRDRIMKYFEHLSFDELFEIQK